MSEVGHAGLLTGQLFGGRYRLGSVLGKGGMGVVYRAAQESLARAVALKVLQPTLAQDADAVTRFRAEAERAGRLAHPHIVQILDFGSEPSGAVWIAMELLEGESLAARIERAPLSEAEVVRVALETLSALEAAHGANLVHRDLKPDNVFLSHVPGIGVSVKVLDFGIAKLLEAGDAAKLTATGTLVGTPLYMAPEQARGEEVDTRADLYSLGAMLYEALTQRPPLTGKTYPALLLAVMTETPRPLAELRPEISSALAASVGRAMAKLPSERFQSAAEMAAALRTLSPTESIPTRRGAPDLGIGMAQTMATPMPATAYGNAHPPAMLAATAPLTPAAATNAAHAPARSFGGWPVALVVAALGGAALTLAGARLLAPASAVPPVEATPAAAAPALSPSSAAAMAPMRLEAPPEEAGTVELPPVVAPPEATPETPPVAAVPDDPAPEGRATRPRSRPPASSSGAATGRTLARFTPRVTLSSMRYGGMASSADLRGPIEAAGGWGSCWPDDVEPPTVNRGRDFSIDIAADGHVVSVAPAAPTSAEPASFVTCVSRRLRAIRFPPPATGAQVQVQVGFGIGD